MYPNQEIYEWLYALKLRLAISDDLRDELLLNYIEVAHKNIWTQYYELKLENNEIPDHNWAWDKTTKLAVLHLAATYFENPDIVLQADKVSDTRMIYRILGGRVSYAKS